MDSIKKMSEYRIMNKELRNSKFSVRRSIFLSRYTCARIDMEMKRPGVRKIVNLQLSIVNFNGYTSSRFNPAITMAGSGTDPSTALGTGIPAAIPSIPCSW